MQNLEQLSFYLLVNERQTRLQMTQRNHLTQNSLKTGSEGGESRCFPVETENVVVGSCWLLNMGVEFELLGVIGGGENV